MESDFRTPLSSALQILAIDMVDKQLEFISNEISVLGGDDPEKKNDLMIAKNILDKMKSDIPRMTIAEIKKSWSISLGAIRKWCGEKFVTFLKIDKSNGYDVSRMIGSFIGGALGIPKIEQ